MSDAKLLTSPSQTSRSKVANGNALFVSDVDGRTKEARRFRDVLGEIIADLGGLIF